MYRELPADVGEDDEDESCDMMTHGSFEARTPCFPKHQSEYRVCVEPAINITSTLSCNTTHKLNKRSSLIANSYHNHNETIYFICWLGQI